MAKGYLLSQGDHDVLRRMIDWYRKSGMDADPSQEERPISGAPETYAAKVPAGGIPAAEGDEPGSAECDIHRIQEDGGTHVLKDMNMVREVFNLSEENILGPYVVVTRTKGGPWVTIGGGGGTYYKHFGRALLSEELTNSTESAWAVLMNEFGEGVSHFESDTGTATASGTEGGLSITVHNFETHASGVYEFFADSGDALLVYFDYYEGEIGHWQIVIPECP